MHLLMPPSQGRTINHPPVPRHSPGQAGVGGWGGVRGWPALSAFSGCIYENPSSDGRLQRAGFGVLITRLSAQ